MGCSASHGAPPAADTAAQPKTESDASGSVPAVGGPVSADEGSTWATKTAIAEGEGSAKQSTSRVGCEGAAAGEAGARADGIPVVGEEHNPHANGQEAPCCSKSTPRSPKSPGMGEKMHSAASPSRPLPKVQLAEAAKLAETRRRFDNGRYKQRGSSPDGVARDCASPSPNDSASRSPAHSFGSSADGCVPPGGLVADEDTRVPSAISSCAASADGRNPAAGTAGAAVAAGAGPRKEGAGKASFDAYEEALMTEILEDFTA